jgi:hypothetical protein
MEREEDASCASLYDMLPIPGLKEGVDSAPSYVLYGSMVQDQVAHFIHSHS